MPNKITKLLASALALTSSYVDAAVAATQTLTSTGTNVTDGDTVTIGATVYRFKTTMAQAYDVQRDGSLAATSLANLAAAIAGGGDGTKFYPGTLAHPTVNLTSNDATHVIVTAKTPGTAGNAIATTETAATLSWGNTTLLGGLDLQTLSSLDAGLGSLAGEGFNKVTFTVIEDITARAATYEPQELNQYNSSAASPAGDIGWAPVYEIGTAPAMVAVSRTITGQTVYTYTFLTIADAVRLRLKGNGTVSVYLSASGTHA